MCWTYGLWSDAVDMKINVITTHGVRSRGRWQKEFDKYIKDSGRPDINHMIFRYGFIPAYFVIFPFMRRHYTKKLKKWLKHNFSFLYGAYNVVVCHSFGTFLFFHALKQLKWVKVEKLILFGSILHCREDFDGMIPDVIKEVHNFHSKTDEICMLNPLGHSGFWGLRHKDTNNKIWKKYPYKHKKIINHKCLITEHTEWFPSRFPDILKLLI